MRKVRIPQKQKGFILSFYSTKVEIILYEKGI